MRAVMLKDWGEERSCLIIAEPTFPPGYVYVSIDFGQLDLF